MSSFLETDADQVRQRELKKYRRRATGFLLAAALILIITLFFEDVPWIGYIRAAAEAGMVGGLADWFAVTALFRRPLGLPIPHTALIKNKKDQLGDSLSGFIDENFFNSETITQKVRDIEPDRKIADLLFKYDQRISKEIAAVGVNFIRSIKDETAFNLIHLLIIDRIMDTPWSPPVGRTLQRLIERGTVMDFIDSFFQWASKEARESEELRDAIARAIDQKASWLPGIIAQFAEDKVHQELCNWLDTVASNPHHEVRFAIHAKIEKYAHELQVDPNKLERYKDEVRMSEQYRKMPMKVWAYTRDELIAALEDKDSIVRIKICETIQGVARRLQEDEEFAQKVNARLEKGTQFIVERYGSSITGIISETIKKWDAEQASKKIELMVGRDLQYIRINGTIMGAGAGVIIYTIVQVIQNFI